MEREMNKRGITDGVHHYIYNHFYNASHPTEAFPFDGSSALDEMTEAALTDPEMAARVEFYTYRAQEELYNNVVDPGSMRNLINDTGAKTIRFTLQRKLLQWMRETNDPVLDDYEYFLQG